MTYTVRVPSDRSLDEECSNLDEAWMTCLALSEEEGYAQVWFGNCLMGDYTDGHG